MRRPLLLLLSILLQLTTPLTTPTPRKGFPTPQNLNPTAYLTSLGLPSSTLSSLPPPSELSQTLQYLHALYGDNLDEAVVRNPGLLLTKGLGEGRGTVLGSWLSEQGFSTKSIKKIYNKNPSILSLKNIPQCSYILTYLLKITQSPTTLKSTVTRHPWILGLKLSNINRTHEYLTSTLGLSSETLKTIITRFLPIYGLSLSNVKESVERIRLVGLREELTEEEVRRVLGRHVGLVLLGGKNFEEKVNFFETRIGEGAAKKIILNCPSIYSLSLTSTLLPRLHFLQTLWPTSTHKRILEYPPILSLSLSNNLIPTLQFFKNNGYSEIDVRGRYLAASLYKRIVPRFRFWKEIEGEVRDLPDVFNITCTGGKKSKKKKRIRWMVQSKKIIVFI